MNPIYDCPLSITPENMIGLIDRYEAPAILIDNGKRVIAHNGKILGNQGFVKKGAAAEKFISQKELSLMDGMQSGEMLSLQLNLAKTVYAVAARFDSFYFIGINNKDTVPLERSSEKAARYAKEKSDLQTSASSRGMPRTRREQAVSVTEKQAQKYSMRHISIEKVLETREERKVDGGMFDPSEAALFVCDMAIKELERHGVALVSKISPSAYLCAIEQKDYYSVITTLLTVAAKNADNGVIKAEGDPVGNKYIFSVAFGCDAVIEKLNEMGTVTAEEWEQLFGEEARRLQQFFDKTFWSFDVDKRPGGKVCISLTVPLSAEKAFSFLRPYIKKGAYATVLKRLSEISWAKE